MKCFYPATPLNLLPLAAQARIVRPTAWALSFAAAMTAGWSSHAFAAPAAPSFSPASGTFAGPISVTVSAADAGAKVVCELGGSTPTIKSAVCPAPIDVTQNTVIRARSILPDGTASPVAVGKFNVRLPVPVTSLRPGKYVGAQSLDMTSPHAGATVRCEMGGTAATASSPAVTHLNVNSSEVIKCVSEETGFTTSAQASFAYKIVAAPPMLSPLPGKFAQPVEGNATSSTPGAYVLATTDGTDPRSSNTAFEVTEPFLIGQSETVTTVAVALGVDDSDLVKGTYKIAGGKGEGGGGGTSSCGQLKYLGSTPDPYPCCPTNGADPNAGGNCTYAAFALWAENSPALILPVLGAAKNWAANIGQLFEKYPNDSTLKHLYVHQTPKVGSVGMSSRNGGHVAYVLEVLENNQSLVAEELCLAANTPSESGVPLRTHVYDNSFFDGGFLTSDGYGHRFFPAGNKVLPSGLNNPGMIAVDDAVVAWVGGGESDGNVQMFSKVDGRVQKSQMALVNPAGIVSDAARLYVLEAGVNGAGNLFYIDKNALDKQTPMRMLAGIKVSDPAPMVQDSSSLYFEILDGSGVNGSGGKVVRVNKFGSSWNAATLAATAGSPYSSVYGGALAIDDGYIYFGSNGNIVRVPKLGGSTEIVSQGVPAAMVLKDGKLYWIEQSSDWSTWAIRSQTVGMPPSPTTMFTEDSHGGGLVLSSIAVDQMKVFFGEKGYHDQLSSIDLRAVAPAAKAFEGSGGATNIGVNNGEIFWSTSSFSNSQAIRGKVE